MPIYVERPQSNAVRSSFVDLPTMEEVEAFLGWAERLMREREEKPCCIIMDIRRAPTPPIDHLKRHAAFFNKQSELMSRCILGIAFVAQSPMLRGALKALFWMQKPSTPTAVARDLPNALEVVKPWLAARGLNQEIPLFDDLASSKGERLTP